MRLHRVISDRIDRIREEDGAAVLVLVVVISVLFASLVALAANLTNYLDTYAVQSSATSQASFAAQSGLAQEVSLMRLATTFQALPCGSFTGSLSAPGATSSYLGTLTYYPSGSTTALTCGGSTLGGTSPPATATIVSTGTAASGLSTTMQENMNIAVAQTFALPTDALLAGTAGFSNNGITIKGDIYTLGKITCSGTETFTGSVTTFGGLTGGGACNISGNLSAAGSLTFPNSMSVGGNVISYGNNTLGSGISLNNNADTVGGNATAYTDNTTTAAKGTIVVKGTGTQIGGNASASGAITPTLPGKIVGTTDANDTTNDHGVAMPAPISFPVINPTVAQFAAAGWSVIQIPSGSVTCANYFADDASPTTNMFQQAISTATTPTFIYAPTCAANFSHNGDVYQMNTDVVLEVASWTTSGTSTFESTFPSSNPATEVVHNFSLLASPSATCSTSTVAIKFNQVNTFDSSLNTLLYTPEQMSITQNANIDGQVLACNGFSETNGLQLTLDTGAAGGIPGGAQYSQPTISVVSQFVKTG